LSIDSKYRLKVMNINFILIQLITLIYVYRHMSILTEHHFACD
jgi:hypothetical protein